MGIDAAILDGGGLLKKLNTNLLIQLLMPGGTSFEDLVARSGFTYNNFKKVNINKTVVLKTQANRQ